VNSEDLEIIASIARVNKDGFDPENNSDQLIALMKKLHIGISPPCYGSHRYAAEIYVQNTEDNLSHRCEYYRERDTFEEAVLATALAYSIHKRRSDDNEMYLGT